MFFRTEIKTFGLRDLKGRNVDIRSFREDYVEIIVAVDSKTGELFVLEEIIYIGETEAADGWEERR